MGYLRALFNSSGQVSCELASPDIGHREYIPRRLRPCIHLVTGIPHAYAYPTYGCRYVRGAAAVSSLATRHLRSLGLVKHIVTMHGVGIVLTRGRSSIAQYHACDALPSPAPWPLYDERGKNFYACLRPCIRLRLPRCDVTSCQAASCKHLASSPSLGAFRVVCRVRIRACC